RCIVPMYSHSLKIHKNVPCSVTDDRLRTSNKRSARRIPMRLCLFTRIYALKHICATICFYVFAKPIVKRSRPLNQEKQHFHVSLSCEKEAMSEKLNLRQNVLSSSFGTVGRLCWSIPKRTQISLPQEPSEMPKKGREPSHQKEIRIFWSLFLRNLWME